MSRRTLPQRRSAETFDLRFCGRVFQVTAGFQPDGELAEVFVSGSKAGSDEDAATRDGAVSISIALQYGVPLSALAGAITRDPHGKPMSPVGAVLEELDARYGRN